jgi:hypothetical protein
MNPLHGLSLRGIYFWHPVARKLLVIFPIKPDGLMIKAASFFLLGNAFG